MTTTTLKNATQSYCSLIKSNFIGCHREMRNKGCRLQISSPSIPDNQQKKTNIKKPSKNFTTYGYGLE